MSLVCSKSRISILPAITFRRNCPLLTELMPDPSQTLSKQHPERTCRSDWALLWSPQGYHLGAKLWASSSRLKAVKSVRPASTRSYVWSKPIWAKVNEAILARAQSHVELIPELAGHLINSGGKRIRPMLTVAAARLCGYGGELHVKLATSVEFMHTATLLHDDVVDESDLRRGKAAARKNLGQSGERAGRRLFARPSIQDDGRDGLSRITAHPIERGGGHRRGRGAAARCLA